MKQRSAAIGRLVRVQLEQERFNIAPWIGLLTVLAVTSMLAFAWVFPDAASQSALQRTVGSNPAFKLIFGPANDLTTGEGFTAWRSGQLGYFFAGLMAIIFTVKTTRAREDSGEAELVLSTAVPRSAQLTAGLGTAIAVSLALGVVSTTATYAFGGQLPDIAFITGGYLVSAFFFSSVAAIFGQLASDARSATTYSVAVLGGTFLLRGSLQVLNAAEWTNWLTPFGWFSEVKATLDNNLLPFAIALLFSIALWTVAFRLQSNRDFGRGLFSTRPGNPNLVNRLPLLRLVIRLNRGPLATWFAGLSLVGGVFGYLATSMSDLFTNNPEFAKAIAAGLVTREELTFEFLSMLLKLAGLMSAVAAASVVQRLAFEEAGLRTGPLLAGAINRGRLLGAYVFVGFSASALLMLWAGGLMAVVSHQVDSTISASDVFNQAALTIPANLLLAAISVLTVGLKPTARLAGWLVIVISFALTILTPLFNLWDWINAISPYWHLPIVVAAERDWQPVGILALLSLSFTLVGFWGYKNRDAG